MNPIYGVIHLYIENLSVNLCANSCLFRFSNQVNFTLRWNWKQVDVTAIKFCCYIWIQIAVFYLILFACSNIARLQFRNIISRTLSKIFSERKRRREVTPLIFSQWCHSPRSHDASASHVLLIIDRVGSAMFMKREFMSFPRLHVYKIKKPDHNSEYSIR